MKKLSIISMKTMPSQVADEKPLADMERLELLNVQPTAAPSQLIASLAADDSGSGYRGPQPLTRTTSASLASTVSELSSNTNASPLASPTPCSPRNDVLETAQIALAMALERCKRRLLDYNLQTDVVRHSVAWITLNRSIPSRFFETVECFGDTFTIPLKIDSRGQSSAVDRNIKNPLMKLLEMKQQASDAFLTERLHLINAMGELEKQYHLIDDSKIPAHEQAACMPYLTIKP